MSVPMKVMMSVIIMLSGSSANPRSTDTLPAVKMFHRVSCKKRCSGSRPNKVAKATQATTNDSTMAPMLML